jgi:hypothetical protein
MKSSVSLLEPLPLPPSLPDPAGESKHQRGVKLLRLSVAAVIDAIRTGSALLPPISSAQPGHSSKSANNQHVKINVDAGSVPTMSGSTAGTVRGTNTSSEYPIGTADREESTSVAPCWTQEVGKGGQAHGEGEERGEMEGSTSTTEEEEDEEDKDSKECSSASSSEDDDEEGVSRLAPVLPQWDQQQRQMLERRIQELLEAFHTSALISTRFKMPLPSVEDERARQERRMHGVMSQSGSAAPGSLQRFGGHSLPKEGLALASNVQRDAKGAYTMHVGDLNIHLDNKDLKEPTPAAPLHSYGMGAPPMTPTFDTLDEEAGRGLNAAFRRALPIIKSMTAFLDVDSLGPELKFKRMKLTKFDSTGKKKKRMKKTKTGNIAIAGEEGAEAAPKSKKKKKKKRKRRRADLDPAKSLAQG